MAGARANIIADTGINRAEWAAFLRDLKLLAPVTRRQLVKEFKALLGPLQAEARRNASWSTRIPKAIGKTVSARRIGLVARVANAPHARPFEGISGPTFRHPVFGNRQVWVTQAARPFLKPAVESKRDEFMEAAGDAVEGAARATGWR